MTHTGSNTCTITFQTNQISNNDPQFEVAFNDGGSNWANNGGNNWKVAIRDCEAAR